MYTRTVPVPKPVLGPPLSPSELVDAVLAKLASGQVRVPPYPAVVSKLQTLVSEERTGTHHLCAVIGADAALTALVLARANSAALKMAPTSSLELAIFRVGGAELVQLAYAAQLGAATGGLGPLSALRRLGWRDALVSAGICEALAVRRHLPPDQAFIAGLLHDFGTIVAIACLEDLAAMGSVLPRDEAAWSAIVHRVHVVAGVHVARAWKLAPELTQVIAEHHEPTAASSPNPMVRLIAVVDRVAAALARVPVGGASSLAGVAGLEPGDAEAVIAVMPRVMEQIAGFEGALPAVAKAIAEPSIMFRTPPPTDRWPAVMTVTSTVGKQASVFAAHTVWLDRVAFTGKTPLRPDWLAQLVIDDGSERMQILANVKSCESRGGDSFDIVAAPYALAGEESKRWMNFVDRARGKRTGEVQRAR
jgi:HD-like signal output (HDOD) protein|nr:HDOD domain-containing protein [Kofleriaceae bacterium]